jgi:hypothetical protein
MTHICVVMAMWQRHELAKLALDNLAAQGNRLKDRMQLSVVVAGSEGRVTRRLVEARGAHYVEVENRPLGRKWQAALLRARKLSPDGVLVLGSDNLVNDAMLCGRASHLELGADYIGFLDAFQYNPHHRTLIHWPGYGTPKKRGVPSREGEPIGSSRTFSARLLDKLEWKIWREDYNRGLDWSTTQKLTQLASQERWPFEVLKLRQKGSDARHLGIKVSGAMSPSLHKTVEGRLKPELLNSWFGDDIGGRILAI